MTARARWIAPAVAALCSACEQPAPAWLLTDPSILAVRIDNVDAGPNSEGLLPIPANRTRHDALPGDTMQARLLVADSTGILADDVLEVRWFRCVPPGPCLSKLREPGSGRPCDGPAASETICALGDTPQLRYTIPDLDPSAPLEAQAWWRLATVATVKGTRDVDTCVSSLGANPFGDLGDCMLTYTRYTLGPMSRLVAIANDAGIETPWFDEFSARAPTLEFQPSYHAEIARLAMSFAPSNPLLRALPDEVLSVPPSTDFRFAAVIDPAQRQSYLRTEVTPSGSILPLVGIESWRINAYTTQPELLDNLEPIVHTGATSASFEIIVTASDARGSQSWATFQFEVESP